MLEKQVGRVADRVNTSRPYNRPDTCVQNIRKGGTVQNTGIGVVYDLKGLCAHCALLVYLYLYIIYVT